MIKTFKILILLILVSHGVWSQLKPTNYFFLKERASSMQVKLINPSIGLDNIISINEFMMFPLIEEKENICRLEYYNDSFDIDASLIIRFNSLSKQDKINKIFKTLEQLDSSYALIKRISNNDSIIIINSDTLGYYNNVMDSVYSFTHEPTRDETINYWFENLDHSVLEKWLLFIYRNPSGDDGLDSRSLALCFLKSPNDFVQVFKQQPKVVRDFLYDQILRSSGFNLAVFAMKMNIDDSKAMFVRMMKKYK